MSFYQINIVLSDDTLIGLRIGGYSLIVFLGAEGPPKMVSTVWFSQSSLGYNTSISWQMIHNAYVSNLVVTNKVVAIVNQKPLTIGEMAVVQPSNRLAIHCGYEPEYYQISNFSGKAKMCGISCVRPDGTSAPICATTLYGNFTAGIKPTDKVYLCFSNERTLVGTVWTETTSSGYVIDVTEPTMNGVTVNFDINRGWFCEDSAQTLNCTPVPCATAFSKFM